MRITLLTIQGGKAMTEQEKAARMVNEALKGYKADPDKFDSYIEWRQGNPTGTYSDYIEAQKRDAYALEMATQRRGGVYW